MAKKRDKETKKNIVAYKNILIHIENDKQVDDIFNVFANAKKVNDDEFTEVKFAVKFNDGSEKIIIIPNDYLITKTQTDQLESIYSIKNMEYE